MITRVCLGFLLLSAFAGPALAETPSKVCLAAINAATARHKADKVPADCWRMGPLHLGMNTDQARTMLGAPDASQTFAVAYRRGNLPMTQLLYVYPRNLRSWLKLAPSRPADFHPATLRLEFSKDALVAISVGNTAHVMVPACKPSTPRRGYVRQGVDFPYGFHGLTLGAPLASIEPRFGKFTGSSPSREFHVYLPVPLSIEGTNTVSGLRIATGAPFEALGAIPDFQLKLDPRSCLVTGLSLAPGH
jgi:hypothetical protein